MLPDTRTPAGERLARRLASSHTRRGFLGRLGAAALAAVSGRLAASAVSPDTADARYYGFCGHTYTTHHCPGPYFPPRIDLRGRPLRPKDGHRVDNLGRLVDAEGYVVDESGKRVRGPTGDLLPRAPRTRLCQDWVPRALRPEGPVRRRLVSLLRRHHPQAGRLLCAHQDPHQRRCRPRRLLLQRPPRVLRPLLPDVHAVLTVSLNPDAALAACALIAGVSGAWSP